VPSLLSVKNLRISFTQDGAKALAVRDVSFNLDSQKTLGIVGESGCGKSVTALSLLRLVPQPAGKIEQGEIVWNGSDLLSLSENSMRAVRGKEIAMIFQDPMTSLNPVFTCGSQIVEAMMLHRSIDKNEAYRLTSEILEKVGIADPARTARSYPHQLSGGMRQRVMIAMALSCRPALLIADEPTTALDVTVQARILDLLASLQESMRMSLIMITHDLGIVSDIAHDMLVMYAGLVAEFAEVKSIFDNPLHPYSRSLLATIPYMNRTQKRLKVIQGEVPNPLQMPAGCPFHPRCDAVMDRCRCELPPLYEPQPGHRVRCFLYE
jgi:oligopeptide/dipeptide ABC transporter ATP-binding protein